MVRVMCGTSSGSSAFPGEDADHVNTMLVGEGLEDGRNRLYPHRLWRDTRSPCKGVRTSGCSSKREWETVCAAAARRRAGSALRWMLLEQRHTALAAFTRQAIRRRSPLHNQATEFVDSRAVLGRELHVIVEFRVLTEPGCNHRGESPGSQAAVQRTLTRLGRGRTTGWSGMPSRSPR